MPGRPCPGLDATFVGVECMCSVETAHRSRIESRDRGIPGWPATVTWAHLKHMAERWEDWPQPHLVLDTAVVSPETALRQVLDLIV